MPSLAPSTCLLLLLSVLSVLTARTAALPVADDNDPVLGHLQRRNPMCDQGPNQNLDYHACDRAALQIPNSDEYITLRNGAYLNHVLSLPREFVDNDCRITFSLMAEVRVARVSWAILRARATEIITQCVGGRIPRQPHAGIPGRGGIDVYANVLKIEVSHVYHRVWEEPTGQVLDWT